MKLRLIELHRRNLSIAFTKWREGSDRKRMVDLLRVTEDLMNDNQELQNNL
jgi:DNA primase